jgi:hypothetical protein
MGHATVSDPFIREFIVAHGASRTMSFTRSSSLHQALCRAQRLLQQQGKTRHQCVPLPIPCLKGVWSGTLARYPAHKHCLEIRPGVSQIPRRIVVTMLAGMHQQRTDGFNICESRGVTQSIDQQPRVCEGNFVRVLGLHEAQLRPGVARRTARTRSVSL